MARVYIACHAPDRANYVADVLKAAGHAVVSTWHTSADPRPAKDDAAGWGRSALRNQSEIDGSRVLVVVASPAHLDGTERVPGGKFVEAGYAIRGNVRVVTVGGVENGMLYHPHVEHVADAVALVELLATTDS